MAELWQLYDEDGQALAGQGTERQPAVTQALLHGASHIWIWRIKNDGVEVLVQQRASYKKTWPDCYDAPAAGHIDLGETPTQAAIRETAEEIGLKITANELKLISIHRAYLTASKSQIENELQWLYLLRLNDDHDFKLQENEVAQIIWKPLSVVEQEIGQTPDLYVPHGSIYFNTVITAIKEAASKVNQVS